MSANQNFSLMLHGGAGALDNVKDAKTAVRYLDSIRRTLDYGRDMLVGWEGWTFPYLGVYTGTDNNLVTHWMNRGPGRRPDGGYYETPGISFITLDAEARICRQFDLFDLAHQMKLCDDLEDAGLLSPQLKAEWVLPMKARLEAQLGRNR